MQTLLYIAITIGVFLLWVGGLSLLGFWFYKLCLEPSAKEKAEKKERLRRMSDRRGYY